MGYHRAGFEVVGVDIKPQPHYPFEFHHGDALEWPLDGFDVVHASPPCQAYSTMRRGLWKDRDHPDLVASTRDRISGLPYVIENVPSAPLRDPVMLCGTMFGLTAGGYGLRRHRIFESNIEFFAPAMCNHELPALPVYGHSGGSSRRDGLKFPGVAVWRDGMDIQWMTGKELAQAIPPAYTEYIGRTILERMNKP